jgi:hypothetical protein
MNHYEYTFPASCPSDPDQIVEYTLIIESHEMIMAEAIVEACKFERPMYQEDIANHLGKMFPGRVSVHGEHVGVEISSYR